MTKVVFAIPLTKVAGGQRPSLPLILLKGGTKRLSNLTLTGSKVLLTAVKAVTNFDARQRRYQRRCLPLTTVSNQRLDKAIFSCSVISRVVNFIQQYMAFMPRFKTLFTVVCMLYL